MLAKEDRTAMLLRIFNDTTPLVNNHNPTKRDAPANGDVTKNEEETKGVASGFKVEDGEVKVDTSMAIEAAAPVNEKPLEGEVHPGPYGSIVFGNDGVGMNVREEKIAKGEDTGGPEQQLNGTGGVEGQFGGVS